MRGKMDCHGQTDVGKVRETNEDQFLIADLNKSMLIHQTSLEFEDHTRLFGSTHGQLLLVADGMGGHAGGKRASTLAVESVSRYVLNTMPWFFRLSGEETDLKDELKAALEGCQKTVEAAAAADPGRSRMGTTLTMAYLLWPRVWVVHAGDSRCYVLRGSQLHRITRNHTVAQRMVEQGVLEPQEAEQSQWSHMLWNCIGGGTRDLNPDVYASRLQIGDTLLLCTDGLTTCVNDTRIARTLLEQRPAQDTCQQLVAAANEEGGPDNITVVVARFREGRQAPEQAHETATAVTEDDGQIQAVGVEEAGLEPVG